jgi:hypothetical protein
MSLNRKIKVRVHMATFAEDMAKKPYYFINIRNNFFRRCITVTGVWCFNEHEISITNITITSLTKVQETNRPLPVIIQPQTEWETFINVHEVYPANPNTFIIRLSNGRYITSSLRKGVQQSGIIPG